MPTLLYAYCIGFTLISIAIRCDESSRLERLKYT